MQVIAISRKSRLALIVVVLAVCMQPAAGISALAQAATVYVYSSRTDGFNNAAQGYVWQDLGLLDANGQPGTVQGDNVVDQQGNVLGSVIRSSPGGPIIGYRNADGSREAYDVNAGATVAQAWNRVAYGGIFHVVMHGGYSIDNQGTQHNGGGIILDGDRFYAGFGGGTGAPFGVPYPLPARPGSNINVLANACYSNADPDGGGAQTSVTQSAQTVPGVSLTMGHDGVVYAQTTIEIVGTPYQEFWAWFALAMAAYRAGVRDSEGLTGIYEAARWIASLPFQNQYRQAQQIVDQAFPPPGTVRVRISYSKSEEPHPLEVQSMIPDQANTGGYAVPPVVVEPAGVDVWYYYGEGWPWAWLRLPAGALSAPTAFHIDQLGEPPAPLPPNHVINSSLIDLTTIGDLPPLNGPLEVVLVYYDDQDPVTPFHYDPVLGWQPVTPTSIDPYYHEVYMDVSELGLYAVLNGVIPGVAFAPPAVSGEGSPGGVATHALRLINTGSYTDTFSLAATGVWTPTLSTYLVPIGAGMSSTVTLSVAVPPGAPLGLSDTATVTATSTTSPTLYATAIATTTAGLYRIYLPVVLKTWTP